MLIHNLVATGSLSYNGTNISYVTGSQTSLDGLNQFSASVNTTTGSLSSSIAILSGSYLTMSGSYSSASGSLSTRVTTIESKYATTGSNIFTGAQTVCANITSTGTIIAQTLNVQQVTSSIVYSSGSNIFGCSLSNTQQFTGSVTMTGSLSVFTAGTSPEFQVAVGGTTKGNALTDTHNVTGSLRITGSFNTIGNACITSICSPAIDVMPSGIGVSTLGGIMRVVTTGTSTGIAVGQSNANRYTHFAANDIQVFNDDFFLTTRCAFPLSIGTCYTARLTFAATGEACFRCQICTSGTMIRSGADLRLYRGLNDYYWRIYSDSSNFLQLGPYFSNDTPYSSCNTLTFRDDGKVGIGTCSPVNLLHLYGTDGNSYIRWTSDVATTGTRIGYNGTEFRIDQQQSADITLRTNGCERLRITSGGNVGIGTCSPSNTALHIVADWVSGNSTVKVQPSTGTTSGYGVYDNTGARKGIFYRDTGYVAIETNSEPLLLNTNGIERMRITSGGLLKVQNSGVTYESSTAGVNEIGTCANDTNLVFRNVRGSLTGARAGIDVFYAYAQPNSADASFYEAADSTDGSTRTLRFKVASNGTVYARSTSITLISSDCKLKTDIVDYDKGLCEVISMKPRYYKYKDNLCQIHSGFIAQEMNEALPGSMIQSYIGQDCNPVMTYQVDWYPLLVNAIKQQQCKINILESCLGIN